MARRTPIDWFELVFAQGVDCELPGIYEWHIDGVGQYIGKFTRVGRPTREYARNVARLVEGRPYRKSNPEGFRRIHRELAAGMLDGRRITLTILENCPPSELNRRERELINERGTLNGGPQLIHKMMPS